MRARNCGQWSDNLSPPPGRWSRTSTWDANIEQQPHDAPEAFRERVLSTPIGHHFSNEQHVRRVYCDEANPPRVAWSNTNHRHSDLGISEQYYRHRPCELPPWQEEYDHQRSLSDPYEAQGHRSGKRSRFEAQRCYEYGKTEWKPLRRQSAHCGYPVRPPIGESQAPYDLRVHDSHGQTSQVGSRCRDLPPRGKGKNHEKSSAPSAGPPEPSFKRRKGPGGPFPSDWDMFKAFHRPLWFVALEKSSPNELSTYRVLGLCPAKCPLDRCFDRQRLSILQMYEMVKDPEAIKKEAAMSPADRKQMEHDRTMRTKYLEAWRPDTLAKMLAEAWNAGQEKLGRAVEHQDKPGPEPSDEQNTCVSSDASPCLSEADSIMTTADDDSVANIVGVLNLCATERYYNLDDFRSKMPAGFFGLGGGLVPNMEQMHQICDVWYDLWQRESILLEAENEEELRKTLSRSSTKIPTVIAHCTHGVNRTGIVFALLATMHTNGTIPVPELLEKFSVARDHAQNKDCMTEALIDVLTPFPPEGLASHPARVTGTPTFVFCDSY